MTAETPLVALEDLARTYRSRSYADPWELVGDYDTFSSLPPVDPQPPPP